MNGPAGAGRLPHVELYTTGPECSLCERTRADLEALRATWPHRLVIRHLDAGPPPEADYIWRVPVVHVAGRLVAEGRIAREALESALRAASVQRPSTG